MDWPRPGVALVTLNRPARLNALTSEMLAEIYETLERLGRDATCRVIIVTGAGRGFCAGDDLRDYHPPSGCPTDVGPSHSNMYQQKYVAELVPRLRAAAAARIAAVNGPAAGAGYALALGADLRVAADIGGLRRRLRQDRRVRSGDGAELAAPAHRGRHPRRRAGAYRSPGRRRRSSPHRARPQTVPDGEVVDAALALAEQIIVNTPFGTWMGKATLWSNLEISSLEAAIDLEARTQILTLGTDDAREQLAAFRERREARYTNH